MLRYAILASLLMSGAASAQAIKNSVRPAPGEPATASVGEVVYEKSRLTVVPAYVVDQGFSGKNVFATVTVNPGDKFIAIQSKAKLKACSAPNLQAFMNKLYSACLYDDDGDGTFDRYGANEVQGGKKLPKPLPYRTSEFVEPTSDSIKQQVTYLGSTKDSLRLSYREFINDMARPAFTEEYTFPLESSFPQAIGFKGVRLTVNAINGAGIHYTIESHP